MSIFFDEKLDLSFSKGLVIISTFQTKSLENHGGFEERNIDWYSPLLSFDLSKLILNEADVNYLVDFFQAVQGNTISFRFTDYTDFLATATVKNNHYGSTTQGRLYPDADGIRTEFQLFKVYSVGACKHFRAITRPSEVRIYQDDLEVFDWSEDKGKITFITPPTGELTADIIFDIPVAIGEGRLSFKINQQSQTASSLSLEKLTLEEIREEPYYDLIDQIGFLPTFPLVKFSEGNIAQTAETEIIDLSSGYDLRTSLTSRQKTEINLPQASFPEEILEHFISFWRCCKGRGLTFPVFDKIHQQDYLMMRFDSDELSLEIDANDTYKNQPITLREVFEQLPLTLTYEYNDNAEIELQTSNPPPNSYGASESVGIVKTTPTLEDPDAGGGDGGSGGNSYYESNIGKIIAISEIQGKLVLFTVKFYYHDSSYPEATEYRIYMESEAGNLDFQRKYILRSLDDESHQPTLDFVDINDDVKGLVFTSKTLEGTHLYAISIDQNGNINEEYQLTSENPDVNITYWYYCCFEGIVYVETNAQSDLNYNESLVPCLNYPASGMMIRSCINLDGINYRVGSRRFDNNTISYNDNSLTSFEHHFVAGDIVYMGDDDDLDEEGKVHFFSWIATVNGKFSPHIKIEGGDGTGGVQGPFPIEEQENIASIIHSDHLITDSSLEGYDNEVRLMGIVSNSNEFLATLIKDSNVPGDVIPIPSQLLLCSSGGGSSSVTPSNLEDLSLEPDFYGWVNGLVIKKYEGRYYSGDQGVHYVKASGELGKLSNDFSEMPNAIASAIYASETRGLVLAYGSTLKYFVISQS